MHAAMAICFLHIIKHRLSYLTSKFKLIYALNSEERKSNWVTLILNTKKIDFDVNEFYLTRQVSLWSSLAFTLLEMVDLGLKSFINSN